MVQFSANFETAVFVNESLTRPQEIHVWRKGVGHRKLTGFNQAISNKQMPGARMLTWQSKDGVTVSGWLLEPAEARSDAHPWPLVTFVHGGPSSPALDEFAGQFIDYGGGIWPHPLEVLAMNGMAVFIPNYRGTATFGDRFDKPESLAGEPADDIVTGIERLLAEGVADSSHLAISGFSHGAWLAPLVMTRFPRFQAASVAEAAQNQIVNYYLVSGWVDWNVIDVQTGFSPYENPQLYLDQSPDLHFQGLNTAILFEAGVRNNAIGMMGSPKAAMHAGMPTEFVIYPKSAHGIPLPRLQRESAERNLDWFRFWLKDEEDPDSTKAEQYSRWRAMRATRCARDGAETPSYCRQR
ncbi:MAG: prolyl oligopeptidase family serine peptidase [Gammaproteobacteria bacterium]